jgi:hypothetical protein
MKVENLLHANQFVIWSDEEITFQSYNSECARIDKNGDLILGRDWDYSNTTLRHLYVFLERYFFHLDYSTQKYFKDFESCKNKKAYIQKLIDDNIIIYDENME